jgi:LysR family nitrogen assimilation transcriptional regulator
VDIRQLRYFIEAAGLQNIRKAAENLHIAQPALTRRIHDLEEELGVDLFRRVGRRVVLTRAGERLLDHATGILEQVERARKAVVAEATVPTGRVAIGAPPSLAGQLFAPLAATVLRDHSKVSLSLSEGLTADLLERIHQGELDLAIVSDPPEDSLIEKTLLFTEAIHLVGAAGHPVMAGSSAGLHDLASLPLILPTRRNHSRQKLEQAAAREGLSLVPVIEAESWTTLRELVTRKLGYAVSVRSAFAAELRARKVKAVPIEGMMTTRWLVRLANRPDAPAFDLLESEVRKQVGLLDIQRAG